MSDAGKNFWTLTEASLEWGVSRSQVQKWIKQGRIVGVEKIGDRHAIPAGTARPEALGRGALIGTPGADWRKK